MTFGRLHNYIYEIDDVWSSSDDAYTINAKAHIENVVLMWAKTGVIPKTETTFHTVGK